VEDEPIKNKSIVNLDKFFAKKTPSKMAKNQTEANKF
jgi:hypothetical protein